MLEVPSSAQESTFIDIADGQAVIQFTGPADFVPLEAARSIVAEITAAITEAERLEVEASGRRFEIFRGGVTSYKHTGYYHLIDELMPDGTTRRFVLAAPTEYGHPADTAAPGDEWMLRKNRKEDIDRDHHYRYVGLFDLLRVTYDPADGTRIAAFAEVQ